MKTSYIEVGGHRGMTANENTAIGSNSSEKVKTFKYLGSLLTNQNSTRAGIECRLKAQNSCFYRPTVQLPLSSRFVS